MANKTAAELEQMDDAEVLAAFLAESQAPLSVTTGMVGGLDSWSVLRNRLGLHGWHTYEEALDGVRRVFGEAEID